jgi:hypothetical protein
MRPAITLFSSNVARRVFGLIAPAHFESEKIKISDLNGGIEDLNKAPYLAPCASGGGHVRFSDKNSRTVEVS